MDKNLIIQMFSYLGYGERAGLGLYKICNAWKNKNWIKPEMKDELNPNRTILTLYMKKDKNNYPNIYPNIYPNNYPNQLSQIQMKILEIIKENPTISVKQISEIQDKKDQSDYRCTQNKKISKRNTTFNKVIRIAEGYKEKI